MSNSSAKPFVCEFIDLQKDEEQYIKQAFSSMQDGNTYEDSKFIIERPKRGKIRVIYNPFKTENYVDEIISRRKLAGRTRKLFTLHIIVPNDAYIEVFRSIFSQRKFYVGGPKLK